MDEPDIGTRKWTSYPFGLTKFEFEEELRYLTVAELEDMLEVKRWLLLDAESKGDDLSFFFPNQIHALVDELARRKKLLKNHGNNPLAPKWKGGTMVNNRDRINRIKERWPIELFLQQSLGCKLIPKGKNTFVTNCPLPYHQDSTPSFQVSTDKQLAYCFGCHRGGDVIDVIRWYLNISSFPEALAALEKEAETYDRIRQDRKHCR